MNAWLVTCDACPFGSGFRLRPKPNKMPYDTCTTILVIDRE